MTIRQRVECDKGTFVCGEVPGDPGHSSYLYVPVSWKLGSLSLEDIKWIAGHVSSIYSVKQGADGDLTVGVYVGRKAASSKQAYAAARVGSLLDAIVASNTRQIKASRRAGSPDYRGGQRLARPYLR